MSLPPAAWHPDPTGRNEYRYWDGQRWTEHVANQGQVAVDPLQVATAPGYTQAAYSQQGQPQAAQPQPDQQQTEPTQQGQPQPDQQQTAPAAGSPPVDQSATDTGLQADQDADTGHEQQSEAAQPDAEAPASTDTEAEAAETNQVDPEGTAPTPIAEPGDAADPEADDTHSSPTSSDASVTTADGPGPSPATGPSQHPHPEEVDREGLASDGDDATQQAAMQPRPDATVHHLRPATDEDSATSAEPDDRAAALSEEDEPTEDSDLWITAEPVDSATGEEPTFTDHADEADPEDESPRHGLPIAAMFVGIMMLVVSVAVAVLSLLLVFVPAIGWVGLVGVAGGLTAVVLGRLGLRRATGGAPGRGAALTGLISGTLAALVGLAILFVHLVMLDGMDAEIAMFVECLDAGRDASVCRELLRMDLWARFAG